MDRLRKKVPLQTRLYMEIFFTYWNEHPEMDGQEVSVYAEERTNELMRIIDKWIEDGSPK